VAIGKAIEELEKPKAKERQKAGKSADGHAGGRGKRKDKPSGKLPDGLSGQTRDKVAEAVGMSGRTYEKLGGKLPPSLGWWQITTSLSEPIRDGHLGAVQRGSGRPLVICSDRNRCWHGKDRNSLHFPLFSCKRDKDGSK
jgi:hypothetical protein